MPVLLTLPSYNPGEGDQHPCEGLHSKCPRKMDGFFGGIVTLAVAGRCVLQRSFLQKTGQRSWGRERAQGAAWEVVSTTPAVEISGADTG